MFYVIVEILVDPRKIICNNPLAFKNYLWPSSKVVMLRTANPPFVGSIPASASINNVNYA